MTVPEVTQHERLLAKLDELARFVEPYRDCSYSPDRKKVAFFHHATFLRLPRLLRAYALLARNDLGQEADAIARCVTEVTINAAWIGSDEARAALWYARGQWDANGWVKANEMFAGGISEANAERIAAFRSELAATKPPLPQLAQRAAMTQLPNEPPSERFTFLLYDMFYRRQCDTAHVSQQAQAELLMASYPVEAAAWAVLFTVNALLKVQGHYLNLPEVSAASDDLTTWLTTEGLAAS